MFAKKIILACLVAFLTATSLVYAAKPKPASDVSYTAPLTLFWLSKAGVPEAVEYVKYIDAKQILKPENISQYERVEKINKIYQEIRYESVNDFIESENFTNVIDLGCGVSPRFLYTAPKKINYVGVELEDVVTVLKIYAPTFLNDDSRKYVNFAVADVASRKEMFDAAKNLDGKICIVEENLWMYLSREKQRAMLENIRDILKERGGCFVTSDLVAGEIFMAVNRTVYGDEDAQVIAKETQKVYEDISKILFGDTLFSSTDEAIKFIESAGLKVEMRPLFTKTPDIISIRDLNNRDIAAINSMMQKNLLWVITVADEK